MFWVPTSASAFLLAATFEAVLDSPERAAGNPGEVKFATSPLGSDFYFGPDSGEISLDRRIGKVRVRIVHSRRTPKLFKSQTASSTGFFVFDCVKRTYSVDMRQDFDEAGKLMPERNYPIIVGVQAQPITKEVEVVYAAACTPPSGLPGP